MIYSMLAVVNSKLSHNPGRVTVGDKLQLLQISRQFRDELLQTILQRNIIIKVKIREAAGFVDDDLHSQWAAQKQPLVDDCLASRLG